MQYYLTQNGIVVIDPLSNFNVVTKSCYKYFQIKSLFSYLHNLLSIGCNCRIPITVEVNESEILNAG